jgi:hypothetical protein
MYLSTANLTERERHVLEQRLMGRQLGPIGADAAMMRRSGKPYTRERVRQIERAALAKLGVAGSMESLVIQNVQAEQRDSLRERAGRSADVLIPTRAAGKRQKPDRGEQLSDRLMAEIESAERAGRELGADRWAYYADRIARANGWQVVAD